MSRWREILLLLCFLAVCGLVGEEDYQGARRASAERAWAVAQWEAHVWGDGR